MLIKDIGILVAGLVIGFSGACLLGKTEKHIVRKDSVTLERSDLAQVINAIELVKDRPAGRTYTRYESNNGRVAFECPTNKACNLELPAADRETAAQVEIITEQVRAEAEGPANAVVAPVEAVSGINKQPVEAQPQPQAQQPEQQQQQQNH